MFFPEDGVPALFYANSLWIVFKSLQITFAAFCNNWKTLSNAPGPILWVITKLWATLNSKICLTTRKTKLLPLQVVSFFHNHFRDSSIARINVQFTQDWITLSHGRISRRCWCSRFINTYPWGNRAQALSVCKFTVFQHEIQYRVALFHKFEIFRSHLLQLLQVCVDQLIVLLAEWMGVHKRYRRIRQIISLTKIKHYDLGKNNVNPPSPSTNTYPPILKLNVKFSNQHILLFLNRSTLGGPKVKILSFL